jgi:hypothetical protein
MSHIVVRHDVNIDNKSIAAEELSAAATPVLAGSAAAGGFGPNRP